MPKQDLSDPYVIRYMTQCYEKQKLLRAKWINLHTKKICKAATFNREPKNYTPEDVSKVLMCAGMVSTSKDHAVAATHRFTKPVNDYAFVKEGVAKPPKPPMMPVKKEVRDLLKESKEEYIKARAELIPEKKYYFVETEYWNYGWKVEKSEIRAPTYGHVFSVERGSHYRGGLTRDPDHYASPDVILSAPKNCLS